MSWHDDDEMEEVLEEDAEPPSASAAAGVRRPRSPGPIGHPRVKSARVGDTWKQTIQFLSSMFFFVFNQHFPKGICFWDSLHCMSCAMI